MDERIPIVDARGLTRRFGEVVAVADLSLQIGKGEVFGILGHNGAGKTTFLRLINGLLRPSAGSIATFGQSSYDAGPRIRSRTGFVTESTSLDDFLTIREVLVSFGAMAGMPLSRVHHRVEELLAVFDLDVIADRQMREISAGMRQRAAFARGLVHEPELLLLDEPTANMDPLASRHARRIVADLARQTGRTVVISTHNLAEAQEICDRVAVLRKGRLQALGSMTELTQIVGRRLGSIRVTTEAGFGSKALEVVLDFGEAHMGGSRDLIEFRGAESTSVPELVAALVAADVPVHGVAAIEPTLEDVYLAIHHEEEA